MAALVTMPKDVIIKQLLDGGYVEGAASADRQDLEQLIASIKRCCDQPMEALCFHKGPDHIVYHYCSRCGKLEQL
jgi:hypothetical protein